MTKQKETILVVLEGKEYKRFVGREKTNHIRVDGRPLAGEEVEHFRRNPSTFIAELA